MAIRFLASMSKLSSRQSVVESETESAAVVDLELGEKIRLHHDI
jgi:hypothetical protein